MSEESTTSPILDTPMTTRETATADSTAEPFRGLSLGVTGVIAEPATGTGDAEARPDGFTYQRVGPRQTLARRGLDRRSIADAMTILDGISLDDPLEVGVALESLAAIMLNLWRTGEGASIFHQQILAGVESAVLSADCLTVDQVAVLREALADLANDLLTQEHFDIIQRRLIRAGFSPLALFEDLSCEDYG